MEPKFIKYKAEQLDMPQIYQTSQESEFTSNDLREGTLVVGYYANKYLVMGYLSGMTRDAKSGEVRFDIENAVEGEFMNFIDKPRKVTCFRLPFMAVVTSSNVACIGKVVKCNGFDAVIDDGQYCSAFDVDSFYEITPYFKETKTNV